MKKTLSIVAATVLIGSTAVAPMAFAQTATPKTPAATDTMNTTTAPMASDTYLTMQGTDQVAASNFIGQNVYASGDKSIGEINDLIMQKNGGIVAAVVGVGGFLGIGEKNVAVPISKITITHDVKDPDTLRLTTTETTESLKAAPEFKTLSDQKAEMDMKSMDKTTTSTMPPATDSK